jgi:hypothetical protein
MKNLSEQVGVAVTIWTCIWEVLGSNLNHHTGYHELGIYWLASAPPGKHRENAATTPFQTLFHTLVILPFEAVDTYSIEKQTTNTNPSTYCLWVS